MQHMKYFDHELERLGIGCPPAASAALVPDADVQRRSAATAFEAVTAQSEPGGASFAPAPPSPPPSQPAPPPLPPSARHPFSPITSDLALLLPPPPPPPPADEDWDSETALA